MVEQIISASEIRFLFFITMSFAPILLLFSERPPAFDRVSPCVRLHLVPRSPKSIGTETGKTLLLLTSAVMALLLKGRCVQNPEKTLRGFELNSMVVAALPLKGAHIPG